MQVILYLVVEILIVAKYFMVNYAIPLYHCGSINIGTWHFLMYYLLGFSLGVL